MFVLYADLLYLAAILVVLSVAAIVGLWQHQAKPEEDAVRAILLSDEVRAAVARARSEAREKALEERRARRAKARKGGSASKSVQE
ncbi:hypothetical protein [Reyranella sp.]|uniref:hypothetical protein n=1 Tax=Reyranella sp. TaxID=1929291 RepID=UPI003BAD24B3